MICLNCGGRLVGDGVRDVFRCEVADEIDYLYSEPDSSPVFCRPQSGSKPALHFPKNSGTTSSLSASAGGYYTRTEGEK